MTLRVFLVSYRQCEFSLSADAPGADSVQILRSQLPDPPRVQADGGQSESNGEGDESL